MFKGNKYGNKEDIMGRKKESRLHRIGKEGFSGVVTLELRLVE